MKLILFLLMAGARLGATAAPPNWDGEYPPCDHHTDLMIREHTDLGVRISTSNQALARQFARAMDFWAEVLDIDWHEVHTQDCSIEVLDGAAELFDSDAIAARAQSPDRSAFQGWIAFNPASRLTARELFVVSVHEIGHLLGLPHNPSGSSVMFFLNLDDSVSLDATDLTALAARHKLRTMTSDGVTNVEVTMPN
jgi:hypothetical protein